MQFENPQGNLTFVTSQLHKEQCKGIMETPKIMQQAQCYATLQANWLKYECTN